MNIPAPVPLGSHPTAALACIDGEFPSSVLRETCEMGLAPVFLHRLAGEVGGRGDGPREMLDATRRALGKTDPGGRWGAGCVVRTAEEAVLFATAGFTWFTFELAGLVDNRARSMSLDELDAAIVALEDSGCYSLGWHGNYLDRTWPAGAGGSVRLEDEVLARAAVKFGPVLAHASDLHQAVRTVWAGRGEPPDIEVNVSTRRTADSAEEFLFLAMESARRGLNPAAITPSLGSAWQPGTVSEDVLDDVIGRFGQIAPLCGSLKVGVHSASGKPGLPGAARGILGDRIHLDFEEVTWLERLGKMADTQPDHFREWLQIAQEVFPFTAGELPLAITEEDTHALPDVADSGLRDTFLGHFHGRQLLLATFVAVMRRKTLAS